MLRESRRLEERLKVLLYDWSKRAEQFELHCCEDVAAAYRLLGAEVQKTIYRWNTELLTVSEASQESGYSKEHLRRSVRAGKVATNGKGIPRQNVPTKTRRKRKRYAPDEDARSITKRLGDMNGA